MTTLAEFIKTEPISRDDDVLLNALEAVRRHLNMPVAYLSAFEGDNVVFKSVSCDDPNGFLQTGDTRPAAGSYCQGVLDGDLPEIMPDTHVIPAAAALAVTSQAPIGAAICIPVTRSDSTTYGMFCCLSPVAMPSLNERDHALMSMFAGLAAELVNGKMRKNEEQARVEQLINDTIADRNFQSLLQPVVHIPTGAYVGAEALTRFRGSGPQSPDQWFADAAQVGLEKQLELATLEKALAYLPHLPRGHRLSLNVSAQLLTSRALQRLFDRPRMSNVMIEITEHSNIGDIDATRAAMRNLREMGTRIAMDDLGAGYSGLSTMLQLKPDVLKMDRTLVRGIHLDPASQALCKALVYFASQIGAEVVAEGIELVEERECLGKLGVTLGQGYLFGRPDSLSNYLRACT